jgi:hypothetical protein
VIGSFTVAPEFLVFDGNHATQTFSLTNLSPATQHFTISKSKQVSYGQDGGTITTAVHPLPWLAIGAASNPAVVESFGFDVAPNGIATVAIDNSMASGLPRWDGEISIENPTLGLHRLFLRFSGSPEGHWAGKMYTFANSSTVGLDAWLQNKNDPNAIKHLGSAFLKRWIAFKQGAIGYAELLAVLQATNSESWRAANVRSQCPSAAMPNPNAGCYLYADPNAASSSGVVLYSNSLNDTPIPTAVSELPISMNLRPATSSVGGTQWTGKIVSADSLQYAGDPALLLTFANDPSQCTSKSAGSCVVLLGDQMQGNVLRPGFQAVIHTGGRYFTDPNAGCTRGTDFVLRQTPWLIPGFVTDPVTSQPLPQDPATGLYSRYECRDTLLPFSGANAGLNTAFAASNPVPDGRSRTRTLDFLDGALIDEQNLLILFRERFDSFLSDSDLDGFATYGYLQFSKSQARLQDSDYPGSSPVDARHQPSLLGLSCSSALLAKVAGAVGTPSTAAAIMNEESRTLDANAVRVLAGTLLDGSPPGTALQPLDPNSPEQVHYFCQDTGLIDQGLPGQNVPCPTGSNVTYFTHQGALDAAALMQCQQGASLDFSYPTEQLPGAEQKVTLVFLKNDPSQKRGTCQDTINQWRMDPSYRFDVVWTCADSSTTYCDEDRGDLRHGKLFYPEANGQQLFLTLPNTIDAAFRYKVKFQNRSGINVGFVPEICDPAADAATYCYDPSEIDEARERVDCLLKLYTGYYDSLAPLDSSDVLRSRLKDFLTQSFSASVEPYTLVVHDGFERLYAELLIMLGDDGYTRSFSARFDLAGLQLANFQGSLLEPNGIDLSGAAGFEMVELYRATQYYQMAIDRLYAMSPALWASLGTPPAAGAVPSGGRFITQGTATTYLDRLTHAVGQQSRAFSEIAKRYEALNQPALARAVVERAYTAAYLQSVIISQIMTRVAVRVTDAERAQIEDTIRQGVALSRQGLLAMRDVYQHLTDNVTYFGFPPDYIPFPALDPMDSNAFDKLITQATSDMAVAKDKEGAALTATRQFDTDAAAFESELTKIVGDLEGQLNDLCGNFVGSDNSVYPAIPKYANLSQRALVLTQALGSPCGLMGNGAIAEEYNNLAEAKLDFEKVQQQQQDLLDQVTIEVARVNQECNTIQQLSDFQFGPPGCDNSSNTTNDTVGGITVTGCGKQGETDNLSDSINDSQTAIDDLRRYTDLAFSTAGIAIGGGAFTEAAAVEVASGLGIAAGITEVAVAGIQISIGLKQSKIEDLQRQIGVYQLQNQCDLARVDSEATIENLLLGFRQLELDALKAQYALQIEFGKIQKMQNDAKSLLDEQDGDVQDLVNRASAEADPNVRIFKNDTIIAADTTFQRALASAYQASKVYEYYTSQSYAHLGDLFLVRTVSYGDISLESYLSGLQDAFRSFQQQFGNPDQRVLVISLKDDIFRIPFIDGQGQALTADQRNALLREKLADPKLLDANGYLTIPFATTVKNLSPLTRDHKILWIEAELDGTNLGDNVGRVYVNQRGTGSVSSLSGGNNAYSLPQTNSVVDVFFSGNKPFDPSTYQNRRLRDRPVANTRWELVINQRDEVVNQDIDLQGLTDAKLYFYYTDFTASN